jgi:predicted AlkP superfamily phosphohydrolase/phosphomutase
MPNRHAKVLLIGWDAADWKIINPLLDQGLMPTLNQFIEEGVMGNLATLQPMLSPMLWNSIATAMRPEKHGIHGFVEPDPQTGGVRPVTSTSRQVKAIWNILTQEGFHANVVGWFAGHPAEPISGAGISDHFPNPSTVFSISIAAW